MYLCCSYTTSKFTIENQMILNFESCYERNISPLLGDYATPMYLYSFVVQKGY
jgi:hypothetical protein